MKKYWKYIIGSSIALTVIIIDLITKILAVSFLEYNSNPGYDGIHILGPFLTLKLEFNQAIAFSLGEGTIPMPVFALLSLVIGGVIAFLLFKYGDFKKKIIGSIALSLMLGGALGNFVDRAFNFPACLYTGPGSPAVGVVDFINTNYIFELLGGTFGIWNIADACLCVGTFALVIHLIFFEKDEKKQNKDSEETNTNINEDVEKKQLESEQTNND